MARAGPQSGHTRPLHLAPPLPDPEPPAACAAPRWWCRFWGVWASTALASGVAMDLIAFTRDGYDATLTAHIRRWSGADPPRYRRVGAAAVMAFLGWALLHLGLGVLNPGGTGRSPLTPPERSPYARQPDPHVHRLRSDR